MCSDDVAHTTRPAGALPAPAYQAAPRKIGASMPSQILRDRHATSRPHPASAVLIRKVTCLIGQVPIVIRGAFGRVCPDDVARTARPAGTLPAPACQTAPRKTDASMPSQILHDRRATSCPPRPPRSPHLPLLGEAAGTPLTPYPCLVPPAARPPVCRVSHDVRACCIDAPHASIDERPKRANRATSRPPLSPPKKVYSCTPCRNSDFCALRSDWLAVLTWDRVIGHRF